MTIPRSPGSRVAAAQDCFAGIPSSVHPNGNCEFLANQGYPPHPNLPICLHDTYIQDNVSQVQASLVTFCKVTHVGPPEFFLSSYTDDWEIGRFCLDLPQTNFNGLIFPDFSWLQASVLCPFWLLTLLSLEY